MIDTEPLAENDVFIGGKQIHPWRIGTAIGHFVLLCPQQGRIATMAATVPERRLAAPSTSGALLMLAINGIASEERKGVPRAASWLILPFGKSPLTGRRLCSQHTQR